jgi:microcystin-dependent protein
MATRTVIAPSLAPAVSVFAAPYAAEGPLISGTSATPNSIDTTANKTFSINEFNRSFDVGVRLRATAVGFTDTWLEGVVTAWDGQVLTIDGDLAHNASSTVYSNWTINVAGQPGAQGVQGPTGPTGPSGGPVGPAGPPGVPGSVWRNGSGVPANSLGANGDYYLNDNNGDVYLRTASLYSIVANINGSNGAPGPVGPVGPTGPQGIIEEAPTDGGYYARRNAVWATPPGGGNVSVAGTPVAGQFAQWTSPNTITGAATTTFAPIDSPTFTGSPQAPTAPPGDNDTSIATTAFVNAGFHPRNLLFSTSINGLAPLSGGGTLNFLRADGTWAVPPGTAAFTTGDLKQTHKTVADSGWIFWVDGTIGDASSGANRANIDTQALFLLYYDNYSDANCPLKTSTGAATTRSAQGSSSTAWAAHCRMSLPLGSGRALGVAGAGSGLTTRALGSAVGEEAHVLSVAEMPTHNHPVTDPGHNHIYEMDGSSTPGGSSAGIPGRGDSGTVGAYGTVQNSSTNISIQMTGSSSGHNNMQPTAFINVMIKL